MTTAVGTEKHQLIAARLAKRRAWMVNDVPALSPADLCQAALAGILDWSASHPEVEPGEGLVANLARWAMNNEVVRFKPRRSPRPPCESIGERDFPWLPHDSASPSADVQAAVAKLPPHLRDAALGWMAGESVAESAAAAGISIQKADYRRSRAFGKLRVSLSAYNPLED